ncbi:RDD family protein [Campylobacter sputorum]|uniref:RDD family protein n=1 Tax=Campylobacter sputorum TaxID=206 RepID=UPI000B78A8E6|nr:RDD family protein [Campylobacter sputorum]ASM37354.1 RDD domain protein [Campylobacter sputorum bv. faecalis CCUG 20703]
MSKTKVIIANPIDRIKAFFIDMFLISMPILYITAYIFLDGKDAFRQNQFAISIDWAMYGIIISIFFAKSAQSPGYRAQDIYLIDAISGKKVSFLKSIFRYICFLISGMSIFGLLICFFRKDKLCLHDLLSKSIVVTKKS